jgi:hypothetical protein
MAKKKQNQVSPAVPQTRNEASPTTDERQHDQPVRTAPDGSAISTGTSAQSILVNSDVHKAAQLIALAALYSPVSQLALSPVYGTAQSGLYHRWGTLGTALAAFLCISFLQRRIPKQIMNYIPAFAFWIPTFQFFLFKWSSILPTPYGPLMTESLTYYPLRFMSV